MRAVMPLVVGLLSCLGGGRAGAQDADPTDPGGRFQIPRAAIAAASSMLGYEVSEPLDPIIGFDGAARDAVAEWTFAPATRAGAPAAVVVRVEVVVNIDR